MKSKRVTTLLACVLSASMCVMPVSAATNPEVTGTGQVGGEINASFDLLKETVTVTVPTAADIRVNPFFDGSVDTVEKFRVASKDLVVQNKTMDGKKENGLPVLITATGKVTKGADVQVYYDASKFTESSTSPKKEIELQMVSENGGSLSSDSTSSNGKYALNTTASDTITNVTMTSVGSRLQIPVAAPTVANKQITGGAPMSAFAVVGKTNENADWTDKDLTISLKYTIRATKQGPVGAPSITIPAVTSGNAISINFTDATMDGATPLNFVIHDEKDKLPETKIPASECGWKRDTADTQWTVSIPGDNDAITWYCQDQKGKTFDFLIELSDGRVVKTKITFPL